MIWQEIPKDAFVGRGILELAMYAKAIRTYEEEEEPLKKIPSRKYPQQVCQKLNKDYFTFLSFLTTRRETRKRGEGVKREQIEYKVSESESRGPHLSCRDL